MSGADLTEAYLEETNLSNTTVSRETRIGHLTRVEEAASTPQDWDQIARTYRDVASVFRDNGLNDIADNYRSLERRAEGLSAKASGGFSGYLGYSEMLSYRILFEIGVTRVI